MRQPANQILNYKNVAFKKKKTTKMQYYLITRCLNPRIGKRTKHSKIFTVPSRPKKEEEDNFLNRKEKAK